LRTRRLFSLTLGPVVLLAGGWATLDHLDREGREFFETGRSVVTTLDRLADDLSRHDLAAAGDVYTPGFHGAPLGLASFQPVAQKDGIETLRLTARHADLWNGFGAPDAIAHKCRVLDEWCATEGRDPAAIERSVTIRDPADYAHADGYVDVGVTHIIAGRSGPDWDLGPVRELIQWRDARRRAR